MNTGLHSSKLTRVVEVGGVVELTDCLPLCIDDVEGAASGLLGASRDASEATHDCNLSDDVTDEAKVGDLSAAQTAWVCVVTMTDLRGSVGAESPE